jgi:hypothetical protein
MFMQRAAHGFSQSKWERSIAARNGKCSVSPLAVA